jgi:D-apiose dehydrogenase
MGDSSKLKAVGVGAGYFSQFHYDAWQRIPEVRMAAVADLDPARAAQTAERFGIARTYTDLREMLEREQPDFVDIITPPNSHHALCAEAARQRVAMICQKPLAPTYAEAVGIVEMVEASATPFMVHENWRWQPWYRAVRRLMDGDVLGEVFSLSFRMRTGDGWGEDAYLARQPYFREYPRLLIFETAVHFIDTFRYLLGEITTVYARTRRLNPVIRGEDACHLVFGFGNGAAALLDANRYNEMAEEGVDPRYTFGTMRIDGSRGHLLLHADGSILLKPLGRPTYQHAYHHENRGLAGDCCYHLQRHFVSTLLEGGQFESHGRDYLRTLRVVEACYDSAAGDRVVHLEPGTEASGP